MQGSLFLDGTNNIAQVTGQDWTIGDGQQGGPTELSVNGLNAQIDSNVSFETTADVVLSAGSMLRLAGHADIENGANFSGAGTLRNEGLLTTEHLAFVGVDLVNAGVVRPGDAENFPDLGIQNVMAFEQTESGVIDMALRTPGSSDRLDVIGTAILDGSVNTSFLLPLPDRGDEFKSLRHRQSSANSTTCFCPT